MTMSKLHVVQQDLIAAIRAAFQVAVDSAVRDVMGLVGKATSSICEDLRRENESLKEQLERAAVDLNRSVGLPVLRLPLSASDPTNRLLPHIGPRTDGEDMWRMDTGGCSTAKVDHETRDDMHRSDCAEETHSDACFTQEELSNACVVKVERLNPLCQYQPHHQTPTPCAADSAIVEEMTLKKESPEETRDASPPSMDSLQVDDLSTECLSTVRSTLLHEWIAEAQDFQHQNSQQNFLPNAEGSSLLFGDHSHSDHLNNNNRIYTCKPCNRSFQKPSELLLHSNHCQQKTLASRKRANMHRYPPGSSPFHCPECKREFNRRENLMTHLRIHTGERPFTCSVCLKCFRHSGALTRHFRIHTGEKPYICGQCGKSFRNGGGLKFHQRIHNT
nr:zinc finger protein 32-like isoform X1 [Nerophis lumbriciformis]